MEIAKAAATGDRPTARAFEAKQQFAEMANAMRQVDEYIKSLTVSFSDMGARMDAVAASTVGLSENFRHVSTGMTGLRQATGVNVFEDDRAH